MATIFSKIFSKEDQTLLVSKIETLESSITELTNTNTSLSATISTLTEESKTLSESIAGKDMELAEKAKTISELESAIAEFKSNEKTAAEIAVSHVATAGVPAVAISVEEVKPTSKELNEKFNSITDLHEKAAFYKLHKNELLNN